MAIPMYGSVGSLFNRLGRLGKLLAEMRTYQNNQYTNLSDPSSIGAVGQYDGEPDIQSIIGGSYLGALSGPESVGSLSQQVAVQTVNRMVFRDNPQPNQTLTQNNTTASIQQIILQMQQQGVTVLAPTVTATPGTIQGIGDGVVVASVRRSSDGLFQENAFAENLTLTCISDSYSGRASSGSEPFSVTGEGIQNDLFSFDWPLGSGASTQLTAISSSNSGAGANLLTNSDFTTWSGNTPGSWTISVGTAGSTVFRETSLTYGDSGSALRVVGDAGGTLTTLRQQVTLSPQSQYAVNAFLRTIPVAPAAGVLTIELVDSNGSVILDDAGNSNSFTVDLTALSSIYVAYNGVFRTPEIMPSTVYFRLRLSTALTNGAEYLLDHAALGQMTRAYPSGPSVAVFSGATPFAINDYSQVAITNSRGAAGTLNTWQVAWLRLLAPLVLANEYQLPSSSVPNVSDTLITT